MVIGAEQGTAVSARSPGRPRLYQPDAERDRILAATLEVLRRNSGQEATVADILEEASLSTRAFYRHFETKEEVILALYKRDAESFSAHLWRRIDAASNPDEALAVWVHEILGLAYDRRRAERVSALQSAMVTRVVSGTREQQLGTDLLEEPLRSLLQDGLAEGSFPHARPELDCRTIRAITWEAVAWARNRTLKLSRREAADHVLRFSRAALGRS
jgi:AcrR family transcriptional regulator